eukprot:scaffold682489_cov61-Prasinocladus_malaysianus.AAC.1
MTTLWDRFRGATWTANDYGPAEDTEVQALTPRTKNQSHFSRTTTTAARKASKSPAGKGILK